MPKGSASATLQSLVGTLFRRVPASHRIIRWLTRFRILDIAWEENSSDSQVLRRYDEFPVIRAWYEDGALVNYSSEKLKAVFFRRFADVALSPNRRGGYLINQNQLVVPSNGLGGIPQMHYPNTGVAGIKAQSRDKVLLLPPPTEHHIEAGVFVGSMAPHNWFHWIIDTLPSILLARDLPEQYADYPLLLPSSGLEKDTWVAALEIVSGGRPIIPINPERLTLVKDLVRIDGVTRPNPRPLENSERARIAILQAPMLEYRDFVLDALGLGNVQPRADTKIFIARRPNALRPYNQDEVIEATAKFGFEPVLLETLSFSESVRLFREASSIIGPHGAGWANLIFAHSQVKSVLWTWEGEEQDNWYENVASVASADFIKISVTSNHKPTEDPRAAGYHLPTETLQPYLR